MKKISIILIIISVSLFSVKAQSYIDALRYSQLFPTGSARSVSMGNAFTSLGGDMSSFYTNPAGLGVYRKSEFVISPGFDYSKTKADYYNGSAEDFKYKFHLNNIGYVGTYNTNKSTGWVSASFGIAYNRVMDFNNQTVIQGTNEFSSIANFFAENATGTPVDFLDGFWEWLAYDGGIIDLDTNTISSGEYIYRHLIPVPVDQRRTIDTKGGIGEWDFSFGTNFSHKLYLGASLSILSVRYSEINKHSEFDNLNLSDLDNFEFTQEIDTRGSGFTFRLGLIAKPVEFLRLGAVFQLPTLYKLEDEFYTYLTRTFDDGDTYTAYPLDFDGNRLDISLYDYKIVSPFKTTGSVGFQIGKSGLISVDVEYVNYASMRLREGSDGYDFYEENSVITDAFRDIVNVRTGGEIRFGPLAIRGGFGYFPSPYDDGELNDDANYMEFSGGIGIRQNNFFIDLGTVYNTHKEVYNLYDDAGFTNPADLNQGKLRFVTSIGFRF